MTPICPAALILSVATAPRAEPGVALQVGPGASTVVLLCDGQVLAQAGGHPLVSILYSDEADIWRAQTWRELLPDAVAVRHAGRSTTADIGSFGGKPIAARLAARVDGAEITWRITVGNRAPGTVVGVTGPALRGIVDQPGGVLYMPNRPGQRLADPWHVLSAAARHLVYPVPASMQFVPYTSKAGGVAYHVLDRQMLYKELVFGGPDRELSAVQYPFIARGGRWRSPPIVWQALSGDWHAAADRYGAWFRSWAEAPRVSRQVRAFPVMAGTVIRARPEDDAHLHDVMRSQEVGTYAAALEQVKQLNASGFGGTHLVGWFGQGHDTTYPDFEPSPEMGGEDGLRALVAGMHAMGMLATFYLNARLANVQSPTFHAHPDWGAKLPNGVTWRERYGNQTFALLCPAAPGFQEHLVGQVLHVARDFDGDGVQLDQIGAASSVLCFDWRHGHATPATAWGEGYPAMLREIRRAARQVNPRFWLWIEGAWEGAGQFVDASQGGCWPDIPGVEAFPRLYRYTLPEHPMFGDPRMGNIPFWCPTDIHRALRINAMAGEVFQQGRFMDNKGLTVTPGAETHWFSDRSRAVVTVANAGPSAQAFVLRLASAGPPPTSARALAADQTVPTRIEEDALTLEVEVPAGQVEAVLLQW